MDFPYLAVLWNPLDAVQRREANRILCRLPHEPWRPALQRDGLAVYTQTTAVPYLDALPLCDGNGILLGVLFDRVYNRVLSECEIRANPDLATASVTTIHRLTYAYWGGYVALISNRHTGDWWLLRDGSGMIPCYYTTTRGVTLASSDARHFLALAAWYDEFAPLLTFEINWRYVIGFLAHSELQIRETGLKHIYELLAGETLCSHDDRQSVTLAWNPAAFIGTEPSRSLSTHCDALHATAQACVDAWASIHDWVVHSLSGGFDSSVVLALLRRSAKRPHIVCVNRYSTGPGEDERQYARIAAGAADAPLVEWPWDFGDHALAACCFNLPFGAKPSITAVLSPLEASFFAALKAAHRFDAIWTGEGGDHLFLALATDLIVADFLRDRGLRPGLFEILSGTARLTGRSIPQLALRAILGARGATEDPLDMAMLSNTLLPSTYHHREDLRTYVRHPWAEAAQNAPPGKHRHIMMMAEVLNRLRPMPATQECVELHPLLSQPLIEQCLRVPTYELLVGGRTRGLARRAFSAEVPPEIRNRELKGQTTHHALGLLHRNLSFLSGLLTDGVLMQQGLLERTELEPLVTGTTPITAQRLFPLFASLAAEAWARAWLRTDIPQHALARAAPSH